MRKHEGSFPANVDTNRVKFSIFLRMLIHNGLSPGRRLTRAFFPGRSPFAGLLLLSLPIGFNLDVAFVFFPVQTLGSI